MHVDFFARARGAAQWERAREGGVSNCSRGVARRGAKQAPANTPPIAPSIVDQRTGAATPPRQAESDIVASPDHRTGHSQVERLRGGREGSALPPKGSDVSA